MCPARKKEAWGKPRLLCYMYSSSDTREWDKIGAT